MLLRSLDPKKADQPSRLPKSDAWQQGESTRSTMTAPKSKPFKLKPTDGAMTRDDVSIWEYTLKASCRQVPDWVKFLPGGDNDTWIAADEDPNHGLTHANAQTERKLRSDFANFLTCIATHCPTGFMDTVMRESTSFTGIIQSIRTTFGLDSKGEKFLAISDIKLEFSPTFTYEQGYMMVKDFCMQSLLPIGARFKNRNLTTAETLSPLAENFIMKEFLTKVHPKLPEHIKNTKGHLFTHERPTLACNKAILIDMMDSMLSEIEGIDLINSSVNVNQIGQQNISRKRGGFNRPPFKDSNYRGANTRSNRGGRPPFSTRSTIPPPRREECTYCAEARMYDSSKGHSYFSCPFRLGLATPYQAGQSSNYAKTHQPNNMKVLLVQDQYPQNMEYQTSTSNDPILSTYQPVPYYHPQMHQEPISTDENYSYEYQEEYDPYGETHL